MPEKSGPARRPPKAATMILTSAGGVVAGIVLFLIVLALAGSKSSKQAQTARFRVGSASHLAQRVDKDGPLLFQDLLDRSRDIYVQHIAGKEWRAFEAHAPGSSRRCTLTWRPPSHDFTDPCSSSTYPADGTGLVQYPATVDPKGALIVDLSTVVPATTVPPSTTVPGVSTVPPVTPAATAVAPATTGYG